MPFRGPIGQNPRTLVLTVDKKFLEALERKLQIETDLCDAAAMFIYRLLKRCLHDAITDREVSDFNSLVKQFAHWFTYDTRQAIQSAKNGPLDTFQIVPSDQSLIDASATLERAQAKLDAMRQFFERGSGLDSNDPQVELVRVIVLPDLEAQVELAKRIVSIIQEKIEAAARNASQNPKS